MKKLFITLSALALLTACGGSKSNTMENAEEKIKTIWQLYSVSGNVLNPEEKNITLSFDPSGATGDVLKSINNETSEMGVWVYDNQTQILQIKFGARNEPLKLYSIDDEFLKGVAIKDNVQSTDTIILKRMN